MTVQELTARLGADEISSVSSRDRTITLRSRDGQEVVVPAPGIETRVYLDLSAQYRYVGRTRFGPFTPTSYGIAATPLTASEAQFSHWFIGTGVSP
jgi:hypothetical protein